MITKERAKILKPYFDSMLDPVAMAARINHDPVKFPHKYRSKEDIETTALISSCLAYGRADLFMEVLERIFTIMGRHPAAFAHDFEPKKDAVRFENIRYRFNVGMDIALLIGAIGKILKQYSRLENLFNKFYYDHDGIKLALIAFVREIKKESYMLQQDSALVLGRGFDHLLPDPEKGGACKRLLLFLRWMVRRGNNDPIDFGIWKTVSSSKLIIPLDTHIARLALLLGLTDRQDVSWKTAMEITDSLRVLHPSDPVQYDFALCHLGMSGACPSHGSSKICESCPLLKICGRNQG